ncbi:MAG: hypothetical protein AB2608_13695 [Candidatus Thiodiazotropha sp.]
MTYSHPDAWRLHAREKQSGRRPGRSCQALPGGVAQTTLQGTDRLL